MFQIRYLQESDKAFWYTLDQHLPESQFAKKVADKQGYIILDDDTTIGVMRYNLFWDNTPFLTMLYIDTAFQKKDYGRLAMEYWEREMAGLGYGMLMTSTQVDEEAQHFYRKLGYQDSGALVMNVPGYEQPLEMFFVKGIE